MAFDYKKEYPEFYAPAKKPAIVEIPPMNFVAVRGAGDPNSEGGEYQRALNLLYGIAFTVKMSYKGGHAIDGFFEYVVPPLEGLWWMDEDGGMMAGIDYGHKQDFRWISMIRLPDFVTEADFLWAKEQAEQKKKADHSAAEFFVYDEGLCVQCMHIGPYDDEPATVQLMDGFVRDNGYEPDFTEKRLHHEIYLSDARRTAPEKLRTVIRHPIKPRL